VTESLRVALEEAIATASRQELPGLAGDLTAAAGRVLARLSEPVTAPRESLPSLPSSDRVLTPKEAAGMLGKSVAWVYENKATLPMVRFPTGSYGFSERGLQRLIKGRLAEPSA
jgi:hypothetical protein